MRRRNGSTSGQITWQLYDYYYYSSFNNPSRSCKVSNARFSFILRLSDIQIFQTNKKPFIAASSILHTSVPSCTHQFQPTHISSNLHTSVPFCTHQFQPAHISSNLHTSVPICTDQFHTAHNSSILHTSVPSCTRHKFHEHVVDVSWTCHIRRFCFQVQYSAQNPPLKTASKYTSALTTSVTSSSLVFSCHASFVLLPPGSSLYHLLVTAMVKHCIYVT
jgi:hypothetical protein